MYNIMYDITYDILLCAGLCGVTGAAAVAPYPKNLNPVESFNITNDFDLQAMQGGGLVWYARPQLGHHPPPDGVHQSSAPASAGGTDRDLAGRQFPRNCLPYNMIEF